VTFMQAVLGENLDRSVAAEIDRTRKILHVAA
jgi:hypothetical protein